MLHIASTLAPVSSTLDSYLPVVLIVVMAVGFGAFNLIATELIGPKVAGKVKMSSYESGMDPIGTARQRFHVRFYVLAMTFLLFDVEVVFLYPWAVAYTKVDPGSPRAVSGPRAVLRPDFHRGLCLRLAQGRLPL